MTTQNKHHVKGEVRHDYVYKCFRMDVEKNSPCDKQCGFMYKTSIPEQAFSPSCSRCGAKMKFQVLRREISEQQYSGGGHE
jgi:hypothetical protein